MDEVLSQKILRQWGVWLLASVLVWLLDSLGFMGWARFVGEPVVRVVNNVGGEVVRVTEIPFKTVSFWSYGSRRISDLEHRLSMALVDRQKLELLEEENTFLRQSTSMLQKITTIGEPRTVLSAGELLVVDGIDLQVGGVVVDRQGVLVGRISRIGRFSSIVERPFDSGSRIAVTVQGKQTAGVLVGDGNQARLEEVLQGDNLAVDDVLVTSGVDDLFPAGLVVGQVIELVGRPADVTKGAKVELLGIVEDYVLVVN
jgi:rod shape-determining protein MreC